MNWGVVMGEVRLRRALCLDFLRLRAQSLCLLSRLSFLGKGARAAIGSSRGPPEDIIHYFTLMSSKLTLFYIIFENWTFYKMFSILTLVYILF